MRTLATAAQQVRDFVATTLGIDVLGDAEVHLSVASVESRKTWNGPGR